MRANNFTITATLVFLILLALLHVLKPENDPSWQLISEYQIGNFGWLMSIAFFSLAAAQMSFFLDVRKSEGGVAKGIALVLLPVVAMGFIVAGIFPPDSIMTPRELYSFSMWAHSIGALCAIPGMPLVVLLLTWSVFRNNRSLSDLRIPGLLVILALVVWAAVIVWFTGSSLQRDAFESGVLLRYEWIGWPNRLFIVAYCVWLIVATTQMTAKGVTVKN
jgi:hypothetical protein